MGMFSSTSGDPSIADTGSSYMSKISRPNKRFKFSDMATSMDTQMPHQDSLSHDTLMGLQELDSHLSMFDTSNLGRESSTPGAMSNSGFEEAMRTVEKPSHVIVIDPPDKDFSPDFDSDIEVHPNSFDQETYGSIIVQSEPVRPLSHGHLHLKPESARDSLASTTMTENSESSSLASISSKSTSPPAADLRGTSKSLPESKQRPKYNVRPRISIPADIHPSEYARQCIAAAESSRLSPYSLHPEEHAILRTHLSPQQVTTYLNIRNGILRLWTRNPMIRVMRDEAVGCAKDARWFDVASVCHEWLSRRGYINYGCLEHVEPTRTTKRQKTAKRKRKTIAVIGAGMAGLGCARQLEGLISQFEDRFREMGEDPPNVVVLEGRDRIGGRVYSRPFRSKPETPSSLRYGSRCTAEMGGMIITGFDRGNPLNIIVRGQLALPYHALRSETELYDTSGKAVEYSRDQCAEKLFNYILERVSEYKFKIPPPPQVDGDKDAVDAGRDSHREGSKTIADLEDAGEILSSTKRNGQFSKTGQVQMIPVSSDRLTGRAHIEPGVPAVHTAAYKAKEIGWTLRPGVGIEYDLDLETAVTSKYATFGSVFDEALHQFERIIDFAPLDLRLINWHVANLEYSNATTINRLSLGGWDLDAGNEWEGKHTMVIGGYQQVPRGLLNCPQPLTVRKKAIVKSIVYNPEPTGNPSKIICEDGQTVEADYIVSTIPLGVLKANDIQFEPELPDWKLGPISRLGFGVLNKIVLVYKEPFWDTKRDIFGTLRNAPTDRHSLKQADYFTNRGRFFQWFNCTSTSGLPSLLVLMAGDAAFWAEDASNDQLVEEATSVLRSVFGQAVPNPVEAVATKWGKDLFSRGSYSYTGPNLRPDDYEIMAKPIGNLFFGGEHTCGTHPATVHGAYISGLRAASEVLEAMIGPISIPQPLIVPKDSSAKRKSADSADSAQSSQDLKLTRREAYDNEVWIKTLENVGERPLKPANNAPNPYRLYCKDKWDEAKQKCNEGRRPNKGKAVKNEVKTMVTAMWKKVSAADKKPWEDRAEAERKTYQMALEDWKIKDQQWVVDYEGFRKKYMEENPLVPGPDEDPFADERRDRRAKRVSGYKEPDDDDVDFE